VFERFTDRARKAVVLAQEESRLLGHDWIGTEHLLLGLIAEGEGVAARALEELKISLDDVRAAVEETVGHGQATPEVHIPFTPRAKKVLELALREALALGHDYIGTEHMLLGLIREGEGVAAQVLRRFGADADRVRATVLELVPGPVAPPRGRRLFRERSVAPEQVGGMLGPCCPTCRRPLNEVTRHQRMTIRGEEGEEIEVRVLYCTSCGRTLGTSIE
jgi:ATP-dependent Clp protease ATP-binding subunit ClpC